MPNIVNPAVAVAAQGGGKFLHNITIYTGDSIGYFFCIMQYISEKAEPFNAQTLYNDMLEKGFTYSSFAQSPAAMYPANGQTGNVSSSNGTSSDRCLGLFVSGNSFCLRGLYYNLMGMSYSNTEECDVSQAQIYDVVV